MRKLVFILLIVIVLVIVSYFFAVKSYNYDSNVEQENSIFSVDPDCNAIVKELNSATVLTLKKDLSGTSIFNTPAGKKSVCTFESKNDVTKQDIQFQIFGSINKLLVEKGYKQDTSLVDEALLGTNFAYVKNNIVIQISLKLIYECTEGMPSSACELPQNIKHNVTVLSLYK